jgi:hypothetical protein
MSKKKAKQSQNPSRSTPGSLRRGLGDHLSTNSTHLQSQIRPSSISHSDSQPQSNNFGKSFRQFGDSSIDGMPIERLLLMGYAVGHKSKGISIPTGPRAMMQDANPTSTKVADVAALHQKAIDSVRRLMERGVTYTQLLEAGADRNLLLELLRDTSISVPHLESGSGSRSLESPLRSYGQPSQPQASKAHLPKVETHNGTANGHLYVTFGNGQQPAIADSRSPPKVDRESKSTSYVPPATSTSTSTQNVPSTQGSTASGITIVTPKTATLAQSGSTHTSTQTGASAKPSPLDVLRKASTAAPPRAVPAKPADRESYLARLQAARNKKLSANTTAPASPSASDSKLSGNPVALQEPTKLSLPQSSGKEASPAQLAASTSSSMPQQVSAGASFGLPQTPSVLSTANVPEADRVPQQDTMPAQIGSATTSSSTPVAMAGNKKSDLNAKLQARLAALKKEQEMNAARKQQENLMSGPITPGTATPSSFDYSSDNTNGLQSQSMDVDQASKLEAQAVDFLDGLSQQAQMPETPSQSIPGLSMSVPPATASPFAQPVTSALAGGILGNPTTPGFALQGGHGASISRQRPLSKDFLDLTSRTPPSLQRNLSRTSAIEEEETCIIDLSEDDNSDDEEGEIHTDDDQMTPYHASAHATTQSALATPASNGGGVRLGQTPRPSASRVASMPTPGLQDRLAALKRKEEELAKARQKLAEMEARKKMQRLNDGTRVVSDSHSSSSATTPLPHTASSTVAERVIQSVNSTFTEAFATNGQQATVDQAGAEGSTAVSGHLGSGHDHKRKRSPSPELTVGNQAPSLHMPSASVLQETSSIRASQGKNGVDTSLEAAYEDEDMDDLYDSEPTTEPQTGPGPEVAATVRNDVDFGVDMEFDSESEDLYEPSLVQPSSPREEQFATVGAPADHAGSEDGQMLDVSMDEESTSEDESASDSDDSSDSSEDGDDQSDQDDSENQKFNGQDEKHDDNGEEDTYEPGEPQSSNKTVGRLNGMNFQEGGVLDSDIGVEFLQPDPPTASSAIKDGAVWYPSHPSSALTAPGSASRTIHSVRKCLEAV